MLHELDIPRKGATHRLHYALLSAIAVLAILHVLCFVYFVYATWLPEPVYDFLDWIVATSRWHSGDHIGYLLQPHNGHMLAWSRILTIIDADLTGGTGLPFFVFGSVLFAALAICLVITVIQTSLPPTIKMLSIAATVVLITKSELTLLCSMPTMGVFIHAAGFATLALLVVDRSPFLAGIFASAAAFGSAGGLLVWPAVIWSAWRGGLATRQLIILAIAGVVFCATYLSWSQVSSEISRPALLQSIDYGIRFLGLPWTHSAKLVSAGRLIGTITAIVGSWLIIEDLLRQRQRTRLERIGLSLILFAFLVAAAAATARVNVAVDREMPVRYAIFPALAQVGILFSLTEAFRRLPVLSMQFVIAGTIAILLLQEIFVGRAATEEVDRYRANWAAFSRGEWSLDMEHYVYPDRAQAEARLAYLRSNHLYGE